MRPTEMGEARLDATSAVAGVEVDSGNALIEGLRPLIRTTRRVGADAEIGAFTGLFDIGALGYADPVLLATASRVGTKLEIAVATGILDTVGVDLVALAVNDLIAQGAEPLFFLDYLAVGKLDATAGIEIVAGIAKGCRMAGAALIGGKTAEAANMYREGDVDLAGFAVGAAERSAVLPRSDLREGDRVLGLASSGLHASGFSLALTLAAEARLPYDFPAPFGPSLSLGRALLAPTRIYAKSLLRAFRYPGGVLAAAHIADGGLMNDLPRILPADLAARIDLSRIPVPRVFGWLAAIGNLTHSEMLRTFNCGVGMVLVVEPDIARPLASFLGSEGETVFELGALEPRIDRSVVFDGALDLRA